MKNGGLNTTQQYSTKQQIQVFEYIKINFQSFFCMFGLPNKIVGLKKKTMLPSSSCFYYHLLCRNYSKSDPVVM